MASATVAKAGTANARDAETQAPGVREPPAPPVEGCVVVLAGGTGGAKLARGMLDVVGADRLVVIANTGDDIDIYGAAVSPDPDLITFWLADEIDERGWGLRGDSFAVMDGLRELGRDVWFNLGDRDLAWCMERRRMLDSGATPTEALRELALRIGVQARVLPMSHERMRTKVNGTGLQEFLIRERGAGPVTDLHVGGSDRPAGAAATTTPEVLGALAGARAVIVGPSNPVISIWPILVAIGEALRESQAPVVAVSPVVGGRILKGPTDVFLEHFGVPANAAGVAGFYESRHPGLLRGMVADEDVPGALGVLECDTLMSDGAGRARVAAAALAFAESLSR
jgi:LPPG:FO 2-phospho-L-lactate transferase